MNVFVIPSWYPGAASQVAGLFVREQVDALSALEPRWQPLVSLWGQHDGALSLRDWSASARALRWYWQQAPQVRARQGAWELMQPALSWTLSLAGGGVAGLLRANRRNLNEARARFGAVQVMHAHVSFPAGYIAAQLSAETGIPYVLTEHMGPFPFPALQTSAGQPRAEVVLAFRRAAATVAVSPALAASIRAQGLPCTQIIPNVVDERRFVPGRPAADGPTVLFALSSLVPNKGVDVLLRALARWNPPFGLVELRIGGSGPLQDELQQLAQQLGVADRVRWLGAVRPEDAPALFAQCHAFVSASRHETFGVVMAEALMCGKPVLATRCGGPESIVHEANGRLVAVDDVDALARELAWLAGNAGQFDAAAIRADAVQRFSRAAITTQLSALYDSVAAG